MRGVLLLGGFLGTLLVGVVLGLALGGGNEQRAATPPHTVTVQRTVNRTVTVLQSTPSSGSASRSASGSASASASGPATADISCNVGQECDLGESTFTVTSARKVQNINTSLDNYEGTFVVVDYTYTYGGSSPADVDQPRFQLSDSDGNHYSLNFDATSDYEIDNNRTMIYETVQPGVPKNGAAIFQVAPDAHDFTLLLVDLISPQSNKAARVELTGT